MSVCKVYIGAKRYILPKELLRKANRVDRPLSCT